MQGIITSLRYYFIALCALTIPGSVYARASLGSAPDTGGPADLLTAIGNVIKGFLVLVGVVATIFLIIGGVQYLTSAGDEKKAATAKQTILYAIIGIIVIALSAAIVNFTIGAITGNTSGGGASTTPAPAPGSPPHDG